MLTIADLAPRVAAFIARGRKPRELTADEKRLALSDPKAFDSLVAKLQAETLEDIRAEAAYSVLKEDEAKAAEAERAAAAAKREAERDELLAQRHEASLEIDAALQDLNASLLNFQALNSEISILDKALGEPDRHRASWGLMALGLKRSIRDNAPALWKLTGGKMTGQGSRDGLSEMSRPNGYDLEARMGGAEPF